MAGADEAKLKALALVGMSCQASINAAEHADISCGGIGTDDWTLTIVRTERGEDWMRGVIDAGLVEARPAEDDPVAMNLLTKLSTVSRRRWPSDVVPDAPEADRAPGLLPIVT